MKRFANCNPPRGTESVMMAELRRLYRRKATEEDHAAFLRLSDEIEEAKQKLDQLRHEASDRFLELMVRSD